MTNAISNTPAVDHSASNILISALLASEEKTETVVATPAAKKSKTVQAKADATPAKAKASQVSKKSFANQLKDLTDDDVHAAFMTVGQAFDDRLAYENAKLAPPSKINSIEESAKRLSSDHAVKALIVTGTDLNFANASAREGSRYNIYAIRDKIVDLCDALGKDKGILENKINLAVMRSMFA